MSVRRIVEPAEARRLLHALSALPPIFADLAHTAAVQGDRVAAALARHHEDGFGFCATCNDPEDGESGLPYPCPTARDLGVTE